jgi:predicted RNase H-like HicB family nuclease
MSQHYVVVLIAKPKGGWRAHFPDFPGTGAERDRVETAIDRSTRSVYDAID